MIFEGFLCHFIAPVLLSRMPLYCQYSFYCNRQNFHLNISVCGLGMVIKVYVLPPTSSSNIFALNIANITSFSRLPNLLCLIYATTVICISPGLKNADGIYRDRIKNESD